MPGGFSDSIGLLAFPAIKFAGYSAFALYLNSIYPNAKRNVLYIGLTRMLLGLGFGTALALLSFPFFFVGSVGFFVYLLGLIPVRFLEWYIIIKGFYGPAAAETDVLMKPIWLGVLVSFLLDIPALIGLFAAGGFWIC